MNSRRTPSGRPGRRRPERGGGSEADPGRRFAQPEKESFEQRIDERSLAPPLASSRGGDGGVDGWHEQSRRGVEVVETLGDRPTVGRRTPVELRVGQNRHQPFCILLDGKQLVLVGFQLRSHLEARFSTRHGQKIPGAATAPAVNAAGAVP